MNHGQLLEILGVDDAEQAFKRTWGPHAPSRVRGKEGRVTEPRQRITRRRGYEENAKGLATGMLRAKRAMANDEPWLEFMPKSIQDAVQRKAIDETVVGGNVAGGLVPLVFDPDVLSILKTEAPVLELLPEEGQAGFKAVVNRIDTRPAALGFRSEEEAIDLSGETESDITFDRIEVDMEIWVDKVSISDFSRLAAQHYVDIRDTVLGERVAEYAQEKERNVLYGDPSLATNTGSFGDADGYEGFATIIGDAGNEVDKSAVSLAGTEALLKDIKAEIKSMLQGTFAVSKKDLLIVTSHTLFDELENELEVRRRINDDRQSATFGFEEIKISGVPIVASHNVAQHTDDGNDTGSEGDVFILNQREWRFRALMPLSTVQLGRVGFSEQAVLGEFGAPILRGAGNLSRYLSGYPI